MENNNTVESKSPKIKLKTKWLLFSIGSLIAIVAGLLLFAKSIIAQARSNDDDSMSFIFALLLIVGGLVAFGHSVILKTDLNRKKHYANKKTYFNKRNKQKKNKP